MQPGQLPWQEEPRVPASLQLQITGIRSGGAQGSSGRASTLQNALRSKGLTTLLSLVETANLVEALAGSDLLTVFAPTNEALKTFIDGLPSAPDAATVKKFQGDFRVEWWLHLMASRPRTWMAIR